MQGFYITLRTEGHEKKIKFLWNYFCHGHFSTQHFTIFASLTNIQRCPSFLRDIPESFPNSLIIILLFLFAASFKAYSGKEMHTACLKMLTNHLLLIGGGWRTENLPWDLTFLARLKSCHWGQDSVISLVTGAHSRSLLHFTWGVISCSEQKFVTAYLTAKGLKNFPIK